MLDAIASWWDGLSPGQQIAVGIGIAALIALSGGSLGLAFGLSGVATYGLTHARGAATFVRDPAAGIRGYLATATVTGAILDGTEALLTFAPSNFAGAAAGRGIRIAADELLDDPDLWFAARRAALRDHEAGQADFGALSGAKDAGPVQVPEPRRPRAWPDHPAPGTPEYELGWDPAVKQFRPVEYRTATLLSEHRGVDLARAEAGMLYDWIDSAGTTYDAVGGFSGRFLASNSQWRHFESEIVSHLDKADYVPVDVSDFSPEQVLRIKSFIASLGDRVFLVGE